MIIGRLPYLVFLACDRIFTIMPLRLAKSPRILLALALLFFAAGAIWMVPPADEAAPAGALEVVDRLVSGTVASMASPVFAFEEGWHVSALGADTSEPEEPWSQPSGRVAFQYSGRELALKLALGDYWSYIFVSVDGRPANRLPVLRGNLDSQGGLAGYRPLLAPEKHTAEGPASEWVVAHRASSEGPHQVSVEVWRGWGQTVLRGVAVDGLPGSPRPIWPAVLLALVGGWLAIVAFSAFTSTALAGGQPRSGALDSLLSPLDRLVSGLSRAVARLRPVFLFFLPWPVAVGSALAGAGLVGAGTLIGSWPLTDAGLVLLGVAGLQHPVLWTGALLFGLPFYLHPLPILPGRALNLIEIGVYGGLTLVAARRIAPLVAPRTCGKAHSALDTRHSLFFILASVALVAAFAAAERAVALREWRTVFLSAAFFALLLHETLGSSENRNSARTALALAWLAGGAVVAAAGLFQYVTEQNIIQAEGVNRVRAFYGSPNNLGLYLERTGAVALALALFTRGSRGRAESGGSSTGGERESFFGAWKRAPAAARAGILFAVPQLIALLLTFSKGALFLGLPAMLLALAVAGRRLLAAPGRRFSARWGWGLAAVAAAMVLGLAPFLGTERFRNLFDFQPDSTAGIRLSLWRSSVEMALDHWWLGVGPDNFLYSYRSGYILPSAWRDPSLNHPHNVILDWWTRLGLPGLALATAWLFLGVRSLWQAAKRDALAVGALAAVAAALGHGLIDASYALPDLLLVWVFLLHLFAPPTARRAKESPEEAPTATSSLPP